MGFLAIPLLLKCSTDLKYGPCPPARDWGSGVSGLVIIFHTSLFNLLFFFILKNLLYNLNEYCSEIFNNVEAEAEAEAEAGAEAMPSKIVGAEAEAEAMLFKMVEAEAKAEAMLFKRMEVKLGAEAISFQICQLEAEAVQKSTASASLVIGKFQFPCPTERLANRRT